MQTYPHLQVAVVDNASTDGSADWLAAREPEVQLVLNRCNVGFGAAHNQLITSTAGDAYLALNPDTVLKPSTVAELVAALESNDRLGWVCGKTLHMTPAGEPTDTIYSAGHAVFVDGYALNIGAGEPDRGQVDQPREVFGANAAAALYRRAMLLDAQERPGEFFDETMFLYSEDVDLDWRARLLGWGCGYVPSALAYHVGDYSSAGEDETLRAQGLGNRYVSVFKNSFIRDLVVHNLPLFIAHTLLRTVRSPRAGVHVSRNVLRNFGLIWQKRRRMSERRRVTREEMLRWFAWSAEQRGEQGVSALSRLKRFVIGLA